MSAAAQRGLYGSDLSLLSPWAASLAERGLLKWLIALTASLGALLEIVDTSIVNVAMPDIQGNLGATLSEVGWISTGYACANVVLIPLTAWLSDRFGRKRYLIFSLVGFTVSSVLCGLSPSLMFLIVARILQGLCGGGLLAKAQSLLFETFPKEEQGVAQAMFGIAIIVGPALGPVLGGYLTDTMGWRWIFFINIPVGIVGVLMATTFLPRDRSEDAVNQKVDWLGIGLLAGGLACFQTMLEEGQQEDWFASQLITFTAIGSVLGLGFFIWRELTTAYPAVDLRVLRYKTLAAGSVYSFVLGMGIFGVIFAVPIFVQNYLHFTAMQSGLLQVPGAIAAAVTMVFMGKFSGKADARLLVGTGALITVSSAFLLSDINPDTGTHSLFLPLILRSVGSVMMFLPLSIASLGGLPKDKIASGSGFYNLTRQIGSSVGIAVITTLLVQREAIHRSALVEKITVFHPEAMQRLRAYTGALQAHSGDAVAAKKQALHLLDSLINGQSTLLSFSDIFLYVGIAFIISLPLLFFLGKGGNKELASAAH
ncbi:MAG: DHA2 family efflux MFS transporter permease subunit [Chthoniobacterales bacterium]